MTWSLIEEDFQSDVTKQEQNYYFYKTRNNYILLKNLKFLRLTTLKFLLPHYDVIIPRTPQKVNRRNKKKQTLKLLGKHQFRFTLMKSFKRKMRN